MATGPSRVMGGIKGGAGVIWHGRAVELRIKAGMVRNLTAAAIFVVRKVKESLAVAGPTKTHPGAPASKPGKPPHRRTGTLSRSITHEVTATTARVGTNLKYGKPLETGTSKMAARPFLRPAVYKNKRAIKKLLGRKIA